MRSKHNRSEETPLPRGRSRPARVRQPADVSRETALTAIARETREIVARWLSGGAFSLRAEFLGRIEAMAATLALWGQATNLTADPTDPAELAFHVIDSLTPILLAPDAIRSELEGALAFGKSALDLGSGAGFPGLVLAAAFDARFTLAEARRKRASYLEVAASEMGLHNVTIERRRVNVWNIAIGFNLVTARAFAAGDDMHALAAAALGSNGLMLLYASEGQERGGHSALEAVFEGPVIWKYRLPHGDRIVGRGAILWRKRRGDL